MDDLVAFVTARLDEDEAMARAAAEADGADWSLGPTEDSDLGKSAIMHETPEADFFVADRVAGETAAHIARHDPARVLREIAAKRAILADHQLVKIVPRQRLMKAFGCKRCHTGYSNIVSGLGYCETLCALAAIWSDHPDYRAEWKPYP